MKNLYNAEYKSHPLISCGNISEQEKDSPLYKHISSLVMPIFEESLKETSKNHMMVGQGRSDSNIKVYVQPHNYRLYFDYIRDIEVFRNFKASSGLYKTEGRLTEGGVGSVFYKKINHDKEISFPSFAGCRVVVKKNSIEITNKINHKEWKPIVMIPDIIEAQMREIVKTKDDECKEVLKKFIVCFGGESNFNVLNAVSEVKVAGEDKINSLPDKMRFHTPEIKKVYNEKNVEFKSTAYASQYLVNRTREDFIEDRFEELRKEVMSQKPLVSPLESVQMDIHKFPDDVFKNKEPIQKLSEKDRELLSFWFFEQFGAKV